MSYITKVINQTRTSGPRKYVAKKDARKKQSFRLI